MSETLFEIDDREVCAGPHVLLPNMSYACGGNPCTKTGGFRVGTNAAEWHLIGCPDCRAIGLDEIRTEIEAQQGRQQVTA